MKKVCAIFLILLLVLISGCSSKAKIECYSCEELCVTEDNFCPNCGAYLKIDEMSEIEMDSEPIDYSDFGFQNNHGMTEWLKIVEYNFSDINNAYVQVHYNGHYVLTFKNGFLQSREFREENYFLGDFTKGNLDAAIGYNVVSNSVLSMSDNCTYEIIDLKLENNVPLITTNHEYYNNVGMYFNEGVYIPTQFIDFSREPELIGINNYFHRGQVKYYIKTECLENNSVE